MNSYVTSRHARYFARLVALFLLVGMAEGALAQGTSGSDTTVRPVTSSPAAAPVRHGRLWLSAGGAYGESGPSQSNGVDQYRGPSIEGGLGYLISSRAVLGLEGAYWHDGTPIGSSTSGWLVLMLAGYPFDAFMANLYFQAGLGVGHGSFPVSQPTFNSSRISITHPAALLGLGYDIAAACPIWITPFAQAFNTFGGRPIPKAENPNLYGSNNAVLYHIGLALRYYRPGTSTYCTYRPNIVIR